MVIRSSLFAFSALYLAATVSAHAYIRTDVPGRLPTHLTYAEVAREALDAEAYPHFTQFLKTVDVSQNVFVSDPRNKAWVKSSHYFNPDPKIWDSFFLTAAQDHLTCLRAFALLGREIKKKGVVIFGSSRGFEQAVARNRVDLGLAMPAKNLGAAVWSADPTIKDPEFQAHIKIFYTKSFTHQLPDEILPANLKIAYGPPETYWLNGIEYHQPTMDADIYYGPVHGVGFRNIKGVGGQKRGVLGIFQKMLFFLPDAISSMTIDERKGEMVTEALVNTTIKDFEKNPLYSIKIQTN
jgi:hypothetical protein